MLIEARVAPGHPFCDTNGITATGMVHRDAPVSSGKPVVNEVALFQRKIRMLQSLFLVRKIVTQKE